MPQKSLVHQLAGKGTNSHYLHAPIIILMFTIQPKLKAEGSNEIHFPNPQDDF